MNRPTMESKTHTIGIFFIACGLGNLKAQTGKSGTKENVNQDSAALHAQWIQ